MFRKWEKDIPGITFHKWIHRDPYDLIWFMSISSIVREISISPQDHGSNKHFDSIHPLRDCVGTIVAHLFEPPLDNQSPHEAFPGHNPLKSVEVATMCSLSIAKLAIPLYSLFRPPSQIVPPLRGVGRIVLRPTRTFVELRVTVFHHQKHFFRFLSGFPSPDRLEVSTSPLFFGGVDMEKV